MTALPHSHLVEDIHTLWDDRCVRTFVDDVVSEMPPHVYEGWPSTINEVRSVLVHGLPLNSEMFLAFDYVAAHCVGTLMVKDRDVETSYLSIYAYAGLAIWAVFAQPLNANTILRHIAAITSEAVATDARLLSRRCAYTADVIRLSREDGHLDDEELAVALDLLSDDIG